MSENPTESYIQNICAIVEERDKKLCELDAKCKYYKDMIEADTAEIKLLQKDIRRINDENNEAQKQLEKTDFILKSLLENQNLLMESLVNHHTLDKMLAKKLEAKQTELPQTEKEFCDLYERSRSKMTDNPLFKKLEKAKVKFRKTSIELRDLKVQILQRKKIIAEKQAIQKKRYYAFFIRMAEDYMVDKKMKELQDLKNQKLMAIKKVYEYQKQVKAREKQAIPKIEKFKNIIFGSQGGLTEKQPQMQNKPSIHNKIQSATPVVLKQQQPMQRTKVIPNLREKLNILREEDELAPVEMPQKVRISEQVATAVAPTAAAPHFAIPENPNAITTFSKNLQILIKTTGPKKPNAPQVDKSIQPSPQSDPGQLPQETNKRDSVNVIEQKIVAPVMTKFSQFALPEKRKFRVIKLSKKWQSMIKIPGSKYQRSQESEDFEMSQLSQQSDLEQSCEQDHVDETTSLPIASDQSMPKLPISQKSILITTETKNENGESATRNVVEPNKSVRFNVESMTLKPKENCGMFSQAMFQNPFQSFFDRKEDCTNTADSKQPQEVLSNVSKDDFNDSDPDLNSSASVFKFYEDVGDQDEQYSTTETRPFGGENMFSFGLNKPLFPFQ